jgi:hypothetical protein
VSDFEHRQRMSRLRRRHHAVQYGLILVLAALCVVVGLRVFRNDRAPKPREVRTHGANEPAVSALETGPDPHRLVQPDVFMGVADINPVRTVPGTGMRASIVEADVLSILLQRVAATDPARLRQMAIRDFPYEDFNDRRRTQQLRGCVMNLRGSLRRMEQVEAPVLLEALARAGITAAFEGQIQDAEGGWYSFYCVEPAGRSWESGDVVQLTGVFFKLIQFPTAGGELKGTPLLVARGLRFTTRGGAADTGSDLPGWVWMLVAAFAGLAAVAGVLLAGRGKTPTVVARIRAMEGEPVGRPREPAADQEPESSTDASAAVSGPEPSAEPSGEDTELR